MSHIRQDFNSYCHLFYTGVEVVTASGTHLCRAMLLICSVDLPARALVANMKQYNGHYSCIYCEDEGVSEDRTLRWPFNHHPTLRSHRSVIKNIKECAKEQSVVSYHLYQDQAWL